MIKCAENCSFSWDQHAQLMFEIWHGLPFSFLSQSWYSSEMLTEILKFGECSCVSFSAFQLASFCQNKQSIKRLKELGSSEGVVDFQRVDLRSCEYENRILTLENCHSDPAVAQTLMEILANQSVIVEVPCLISLLYKRLGADENGENTAECLELLLRSKQIDYSKCYPDFMLMKQKCVCNAVVHAAYKLVPSIYKALSGKCCLPQLTFFVGSQIPPDTIYTELEHSALYVFVFYDSTAQKYYLQMSYDYAHEMSLVRPLFVESEFDLTSLFANQNVQSIMDMLSFLFPNPKFSVKDAQATQIMNQLTALHSYFRKLKTLGELAKHVINQSIAAPYTTNVKSLYLPVLIKDFVALK